ncbi:MAG TPA: TIGR01777 family oxidoreductase [Pirellulales bacterium]|nr:TIGR01777 family oxidoreductase [Pirellulales bacterium]
MRALITGATGFVGSRLLKQIDEPVVLSRNPESAGKALGGVEAYAWDLMSGPPPAEAFRGVEAVFHLAGEPVAEGRWNADKKRRIMDSRKIGTANLVQGIERLAERPAVLVSASAVGYYGSRGDEILDESAAPASDFLAEVCIEWERAAERATTLGVRVVNPRIGIVLGAGGGALGKMLLPFKLGLGGRLASGKQWMPWIHRDDLVGLFLHAASHHDLRGPMNAVAPNPVTNREFTRTLAGAVHRPAIFPAPGPMLKLLVGEFAEVLLASQRVVPRVAERSSYRFQYPELAGALRAILDRGPSAEARPPKREAAPR